MPKATFFNLLEEKRERLIFLSFTEFALNAYSLASITKIAREMQIAKGSIYQYFTNKRDLYNFLIETASEAKLEATSEFHKKINEPFHKWFRKFCVASITWDLQNPIMACFLSNVSKERTNPELGNVQLEHKKRSVSFFEKKISKLIQKDQIDSNIDAYANAVMLSEFSNGIVDQLCIHFNIDLLEHALENKPVQTLTEKDIKQYVKAFNNLVQRMIPQ